MSSPFIGEMRITAFNFAPKGWAQCDGGPVTIAQNKPLFSILGTTYGGDGTTTFKLPDMRGATPVHVGNGIPLGAVGGEVGHTLTAAEIPQHTHAISATNTAGTAPSPALNFFANSNVQPYRTDSNTTLSPESVSTVGASQPHNNMQPYLVLNFIIALQGILPSQT